MFKEVGKQVVGLDIGGANLKAAVWRSPAQVDAASLNFPLWKQPERLPEAIAGLLDDLKVAGHLAVTMTGELADCFANRREGVRRIVDALLQLVPSSDLSLYAVDGRWMTANQAQADPWSVAASNWHALATWLAHWPVTSFAFECSVLVDIGSTTVDILPIEAGTLLTDARTDRERLERAQLVYTGLRRTPVCALVPSLWLDGRLIPTMAELFATVDDAYLLLGLVASDATDCDTADGRPRTEEFAASRIARMIGEDAERLTPAALSSLAEQIIQAQATLVANAIKQNLRRLNTKECVPTLICCGHGLPLFQQTIRKISIDHQAVWIGDYLSNEVCRSAPAAAVAWLWQQRTPLRTPEPLPS